MILKCDYCNEDSVREDGNIAIYKGREIFKCEACCDIDDTETLNNDGIECPHCGFKETDDLYVYESNEEFECQACGKISDLSVSTETTYLCSKKREG